MLELCLQVFVHDLVEAAAEDVGLPDLCRVALELLQEVVDHVLALLFVADDGRNRRFDVGANDVQARRARLAS